MGTDMNMRTYEWLLDLDLSAANFTTNGQIMSAVRKKISMATNVPMRRVVSMHDLESIYLVPEALREASIDREVLTILNLHERVDQRHEDQARTKWRWFVDHIGRARRDVTIAVTGKYTALR